jgi:hypothetical protein
MHFAQTQEIRDSFLQLVNNVRLLYTFSENQRDSSRPSKIREPDSPSSKLEPNFAINTINSSRRNMLNEIGIGRLVGFLLSGDLRK